MSNVALWNFITIPLADGALHAWICTYLHAYMRNKPMPHKFLEGSMWRTRTLGSHFLSPRITSL